ncbi:MAG: hypothetical protein U0840_04830 [Gemmataceae bacterium]
MAISPARIITRVGTHAPHLDDAGWWVCTGLALHEIEELLDWLEHNQCPRPQVQIDLVRSQVRWRMDPPHGP